MLFPYRNDLRKSLIPYLKELDENSWYKKSDNYPKTIAWIITHISQSEEFWINSVGFKKNSVLTIHKHSSPIEILNGYIEVRNNTDNLLATLDPSQLSNIVHVPKFSDGWVPPSEPTINWFFHHVFSHEAYHVGQIAIIANINGFKKPLF
ncbi:DinB family protein [Bacillus sp. CGMCC 1.16607]|uniref:DinB family protein n=1 Tax=Bacillus sp. CGMCC 1.16607 TaxID=3351842 RepID=UPI003625C88A